MAHLRPGDVVSRRKGLVMHRGVVLRDGRILHNTPFKGEHVCSPREFRAGRRMYVQTTDADTRQRVRRAGDAHLGGRGYNVLTNNCEHTVSRLTHGKAESPQLRSWLLGTGLAVAAFALTRHPAAAAAAYAVGRKVGAVRPR